MPASGDDHRDAVGPARRPRPARRAVRPRGDRPFGPVDPSPPPRRASPLCRSRRRPDVAGQLAAERGPDPTRETRSRGGPDRDGAPVRGGPGRARRAGGHARPARRSRRARRPVLLDPDGASGGPRRGRRLARRPVRVRARPGRRAVPRRRRRGVAGPPRRRSGSVRGGCRRRPVGRPARELPAVRRAALRLLRPVCRARLASPASARPTRSSRSASACSARRIRSWPRAPDARPGGRAGQPVSA